LLDQDEKFEVFQTSDLDGTRYLFEFL